jgi:hypothetical protein
MYSGLLFYVDNKVVLHVHERKTRHVLWHSPAFVAFCH